MPGVEVWSQVGAAVGTLALAGVTAYQLAILKHQRHRQRHRELVDRFYVPLRAEMEAWMHPRQDFQSSHGAGWDDFESATFEAWPKLRWEAPYLLDLVPEDLAQKLNRAEDMFEPVTDHASFYKSQIYDLVGEEAGEVLDLDTSDGRRSAHLRLMSEDTIISTNVNVFQLWLTDESVENWAVDQTRGPRYEDWRLTVGIGAETVGGHDDALQVLERVHERLEEIPEARWTKQRVHELRELAREVTRTIETELGASTGRGQWGPPPSEVDLLNPSELSDKMGSKR